MHNHLQDPMQFTYWANRSVESAMNLALHLKNHLIYAQILFVGFKTIFLHLMFNKLKHLDITHLFWVHDFLWNRKQCVRVGDHISSTLFTSTESPQGCAFLHCSLLSTPMTAPLWVIQSNFLTVPTTPPPQSFPVAKLLTGNHTKGKLCEKTVDFLETTIQQYLKCNMNILIKPFLTIVCVLFNVSFWHLNHTDH